MLHLLGFDHEISEEAEVEMEKEEELLLTSLEWRGKGLIQSAIDAQTNSDSAAVVSDGKYVVVIIVLLMTAYKFLCDYCFKKIKNTEQTKKSPQEVGATEKIPIQKNKTNIKIPLDQYQNSFVHNKALYVP